MLDGFVPVTAASELPPGAMKWVVVDRERMLVANVDGVFYALRGRLRPRGRRPSRRATLVGYVVECPLHYACFDVRTGKLLSGPVSGGRAHLRGAGRRRHGVREAVAGC